MEFEHATTNEAVEGYKSTVGVFSGLISEMRELSKKKPDLTLNKGKVRILNRVLLDIQNFLKDEPEGKYLDLLDDDQLPQNSDAVLVMVQFETALRAFKARYHKRMHGNDYWITKELLDEWEELDREDEDFDSDDFSTD